MYPSLRKKSDRSNKLLWRRAKRERGGWVMKEKEKERKRKKILFY